MLSTATRARLDRLTHHSARTAPEFPLPRLRPQAPSRPRRDPPLPAPPLPPRRPTVTVLEPSSTHRQRHSVADPRPWIQQDFGHLHSADQSAPSHLESKLDTVVASMESVHQRLSLMEANAHSTPTRPVRTIPKTSPEQRKETIKQHLRDADLVDEEGSTHPTTIPQVSTNSGKTISTKSGRFTTTFDSGIMHHIPWPHHVIYKGLERKPIRFDELSIQELVLGALKIALQSEYFKYMIKQLIQLMEDACLYEWSQCRFAYGVLLQEIELDNAHWDQPEKIEYIRQLYAHSPEGLIRQSHGKPRVNRPHHQDKSPSHGRPCRLYQFGNCTHTTDHQAKGYTFRHICMFCWNIKKLAFTHPENQCISKL